MCLVKTVTSDIVLIHLQPSPNAHFADDEFEGQHGSVTLPKTVPRFEPKLSNAQAVLLAIYHVKTNKSHTLISLLIQSSGETGCKSVTLPFTNQHN